MGKVKFNLKENVELRRKLLGEAPLVASKAAEWPNYKPKKPWTGPYAKYESLLKTIGKPFPLEFEAGTVYEVPVANDYLYVYDNGELYSTNFSQTYKYGTNKDYPDAKLVISDDNGVIGTINIGADGKAKWTQIEPEKSEEEATESENPFLDKLQLVLTFVGFVPGIGDIVDLINAAISFARGNLLDGFMNLIGAIPMVGSAIIAPFKVIKSSKYLGKIAEAFAKAFPGFAKTVPDVMNQQRHMDEMWALMKESGHFTPAEMNRFAAGLGDAADFVKSASKKGQYLLPDAALKSLDDLSEWFARSAKNGEEWLAKNAKVAKETPGSFLLKTRKVDDVAKSSGLLRRLPGYKFIASKFTAKLNPAEISKLRGALNAKFMKSIETPGQIVALAKSETKLLQKLEDEIQTASVAALQQLKRQNPTKYRDALNALRQTNKTSAGGATQLQNLLQWQKSYDPKGFENARSAIAREATRPDRPNVFYNNFMDGEWQSLQTYGFNKDYWAKAGTNIPNLDIMNRRFQDFVPILWNEVKDMGEDVKAEMGIESPDDVNGLFWPMLKSIVSGAEYVGVPGVEWTKNQIKGGVRGAGTLLNMIPGVDTNDPLTNRTYNPETEFVIHPDDSSVIKKREQRKQSRIEKSRSWF